MEVPVYSSINEYFSDVEFFSLQNYVNVMEEDPEDCPFETTKYLDCKRDFMQPIHCIEADN